MGVTHHWYRPMELATESFARASADCRKLLENVEGLAGFDGRGKPLFTGDRIVFNGDGGSGCEPFEVAAVEFDRRGRAEFFGHCKTEGRPYDFYVKVALIVLAHHLTEQLCVSSDEPQAEWNAAREKVKAELGYGDDFTLAAV